MKTKKEKEKDMHLLKNSIECTLFMCSNGIQMYQSQLLVIYQHDFWVKTVGLSMKIMFEYVNKISNLVLSFFIVFYLTQSCDYFGFG